jgi:hypothetical protein
MACNCTRDSPWEILSTFSMARKIIKMYMQVNLDRHNSYQSEEIALQRISVAWDSGIQRDNLYYYIIKRN